MPVGSRQLGGGSSALAAGWDRWRRGWSPPLTSPPSGDIPGSVKVELFIAEAWVDITRLDNATAGVYYRDNIVITRGKSDEAVDLDRGTCTFTLNNRDGRFSPRNPTSPYYGKIGRNTPVRVSVVQSGTRRYRFYGEVSAWPQKWDITGTDVYVNVEASGILRRLGQGSSPLDSPMYRGCVRSIASLIAYWPCQDSSSATTIASATTGVKAMTIAGTPTLASDSTHFIASTALPVMNTGAFTGTIPTYSTTQNYHVIRFLLNVPSGTTNNQVICQLLGTGSIVKWELYYQTASSGLLGLRGFDSTGANVADTTGVAFAITDSARRVSIELHQTGTSIDYTITTLVPGAGSGSTFTANVAAQTIGKLTRIVMAPNKGMTTTTMGHVTVQNAWTSLFDLSDQLIAYNGEHAGPRITRLCAEEAINFARRSPVGTSVAMGIQSTDTLVNLIRAAVNVDLGRLSEPRDQVGFGYRDRQTLYNQTAVLALDYSAANLADSLDPVDDDQYTRNDITVTRSNGGSSVRATLDTGTNSIASVGRYDESVTLNLGTDSIIADETTWLLHLGTTDEARYPTVELNLLHSTFTGNDAMMTAALVLDIGDMVTISNLPAWLPPDQVRLLVEGYTETIGGNGQHTMTLNCSPASPYDVAVYATAVAATADKYSPTASTLATDYSSSATSLSVASDTTDGGQLWTTSGSEYPLDIKVAGERMTLTAVSGSSSPQTFTVTRSVNGIVKAQSSGATVTLFSPNYYDIGA